MNKLLIILLPLMILFLPKSALAQTRSEVNVQTTGDSHVDVKSNVSSSNNTSYSSSSNGNISIHTDGGTNNSNVSINNDKFSISGKVTLLSQNNVSLSGQDIVITPSQSVNLKIDQEVTIKGSIKGGILYAEEISGQTAPTPQPSSSAAATSSPEMSMSPFPISPFPSDFPFKNKESGFMSFFDRIFSIFKRIF